MYDGRSLLLKVAIFFIASPFFILFPGRLDASFLISDGCAVKNSKLISLVSFVSSTFSTLSLPWGEGNMRLV